MPSDVVACSVCRWRSSASASKSAGLSSAIGLRAAAAAALGKPSPAVTTTIAIRSCFASARSIKAVQPIASSSECGAMIKMSTAVGSAAWAARVEASMPTAVATTKIKQETKCRKQA